MADYDYEDVSFQRFTNETFINFLKDEAPSTESGEEHLPPRMVRWINIAGIDWSVLRAVALRYSTSLFFGFISPWINHSLRSSLSCTGRYPS